MGDGKVEIAEAADRHEVVTAVSDFYAKGEPHAIQPFGERFACRTINKQPEGLRVIDDAHRVLDPPIRVQQQRLRAVPRTKPGQRLSRERIKPREPVWTSNRNDGPVSELDDGLTINESALLTERVSVVLGRSANGTGSGIKSTIRHERASLRRDCGDLGRGRRCPTPTAGEHPRVRRA